MISNESAQQMFVNGEWIDSLDGDTIEVENPATKTIVTSVPRARASDVDRAVNAAVAAAEGWGRTTPAERSRSLARIADAIEAEQESIARSISLENGNALRTQSRREALQAANIFRYYGQLCHEMKGQAAYLGPNTLDYTRREPYGVVGAITPWNAPASLASIKIAGALCTGNSIVLKASELAPTCVLEIARLSGQFLPPGVLNVLTGFGDECGAPLAAHPRVPKVSFTGSTAVGRSILVAASQRIASVSLELGGKSAQIVLPDVDVNRVADGVIAAMRFTRQGQSCTAGSRLYIHEKVADAVLDAVISRLMQFRVGDPMDETTDVGAIVNEKQFNRVCGYVEYASRSAPNALRLGGLPPREGPLSRGYYFEPTVFFGIPDDTPLAREEVFGPVLSIDTWREEGEVIARANDSPYGLAGYIWGVNGAATLRIAHALKAGWVMVNQGGAQLLGHSYGGMRQSGLGREMSLEGVLEAFTEVKQVSVGLTGS